MGKRTILAGSLVHHYDNFGTLQSSSKGLLGQFAAIAPRYALHGGSAFHLRSTSVPQWVVAPSFLFKLQGGVRQLDTGINLRANYETFIISGGLWCRGVPLWKQEIGQLHLDALSGMLSLKVGGGFVVGYSLDIPVIRPYTALMRTAHELCLVIGMGGRHQRRGHNFVQFPFNGRY